MIIGLGADHGGYELKNQVIEHLQKKEYQVLDFGVNTPDSVDYPDIAKRVCSKVNKGEIDLAILFCGTGIGISIAANKIKGIRCGLIYNKFSAQMARKHNNCNAIAMGGRTIDRESALKMIDEFLSEQFEGGRHKKRIDKIHKLED